MLKKLILGPPPVASKLMLKKIILGPPPVASKLMLKKPILGLPPVASAGLPFSSSFHQKNHGPGPPNSISMSSQKRKYLVLSFHGKDKRNNFTRNLPRGGSISSSFHQNYGPPKYTSIASRKWKYDVFLSFHGQDTRNNFTSHLYGALKNANINTFIDTKIPRGDSISSSLPQAIETSRIAIIVFSPNFASSTWCLEEVTMIRECKHSRGQLVLPVFHHVAPSDIRKQTGVLQPIFAKLDEDFSNDLLKVKRWREALHEIAGLGGWPIDHNVVEADVIQKIVEEVSRRLLKSKSEE